MSKLRSVNTHFWNDNYVIDLDPLEKLLFLYLVTNANTNMLGIYELHIRKIAFETGIDKDMVVKIFDRFAEANKIKYKEGYVILANFLKNQSFNPNMETSAIKSWNELPLSIRQDSFCKPIAKGLKAFTKASEPIAKYELELELEDEVEVEREPTKTESEATEVAHALLDSICESDPTHAYNRNKPALDTWIKDIDLAIRRDGRKKEDLLHMIQIIFFGSNKISKFWQSNIQSGKKLRKHFDLIKTQIKNETNHGKHSEIDRIVNSMYQ